MVVTNWTEKHLSTSIYKQCFTDIFSVAPTDIPQYITLSAQIPTKQAEITKGQMQRSAIQFRRFHGLCTTFTRIPSDGASKRGVGKRVSFRSGYCPEIPPQKATITIVCG